MRWFALLSQSWIIALASLLAWPGCGTTGSGSQFPSREELQRLAERPAASLPSKGDVADVEEWELVGPLPTEINEAVVASGGPLSRVVTELANTRPGLVLASTSAACTARELGIFVAAKKVRMTESLQRFIAARCGLTGTTQIAYGSRYQEVHSQVDEQKIAAEWSPSLKSDMQKALAGSSGAHLVGLWFGRRDDFLVATWVVVPRQARLDAMAIAPASDGQVVIRGEVLYRAEKLEGLINRGAHGFRRCEADPTVKMPQFSLRCQADKDDEAATVQVAAFEPGRVLGHVILSLVVWPKGEPANRYRRPTLVDVDSSQSTGMATELASLVNRVRSQAGLKPLRFSEPESQSARRVAPHYFAALAGLEAETVADQVILGLRAGWEVGSPLRSGQFTSGASQGSVSTARLLSEVLELPGGREALLNPESDHLAIGTFGSPAQGFVGVLFTTYATFDLGNTQSHAERVHQRLAKLRAQKGLERADRLPKLEADLAAVVATVSSGELNANQGLERVLSVAAERTRGEVRAYYVDTYDLDQLEIPDPILAAQTLRIAIAVGQHQAPGDPWRRYIVYFVTAEGTGTVALSAHSVTSSKLGTGKTSMAIQSGS
jgi:hypothetical protein